MRGRLAFFATVAIAIVFVTDKPFMAYPLFAGIEQGLIVSKSGNGNGISLAPIYSGSSKQNDDGFFKFVREERGTTEELISGRIFIEVDRSGTVADLLKRRVGGWAKLVEVDSNRMPATDTLLAWVQHFDENTHLDSNSKWADLVISCHPEIMPESVRSKHVLPQNQGSIYIYTLPYKMVLVSSQKEPALELVLWGPYRSTGSVL